MFAFAEMRQPPLQCVNRGTLPVRGFRRGFRIVSDLIYLILVTERCIEVRDSAPYGINMSSCLDEGGSLIIFRGNRHGLQIFEP
jgi:hypothetical protein